MSAVEKIVRMAAHTFRLAMRQGSCHESESQMTLKEKNSVFSAALVTLQDSLKNLTAEDVNLHKSMESTRKRLNHTSYIEIFENHIVSVGIFVVHPGATIPLHDHPNMFGLLKVLHGKVRITSFNVCNSVQTSSGELVYKAKLSSEECHSRFSPPALLSPAHDNVHEISFENGENGQDYAAFIDILSPPYYSHKSGPECFYYRKLENITERSESGSVDAFQILKKTNVPPPDFYTYNVAYYGPQIREIYN